MKLNWLIISLLFLLSFNVNSSYHDEQHEKKCLVLNTIALHVAHFRLEGGNKDKVDVFYKSSKEIDTIVKKMVADEINFVYNLPEQKDYETSKEFYLNQIDVRLHECLIGVKTTFM